MLHFPALVCVPMPSACVHDLPTVFRQQGHVAGVGTPHHVLDLGDLDGSQRAFLLHVEHGDSVCVAQQQGARAGVEDLLAAGHLHLLHYLVLQVLYQQLRAEEKGSVTPIQMMMMMMRGEMNDI